MSTSQAAAVHGIMDKQEVVEVNVAQPWDSQCNRFNIPAVCTCCLAPTTNMATAKWSYVRKYHSAGYRVTESQSASLDFCVCPECVAHEKEYRRKRLLMIKISTFVAALISAMLILGYEPVLDAVGEVNFALALFIGFVLLPFIWVLPIVYVLDHYLPQRLLDHRHASRMKGVRMKGPHLFEFDNPVYAQLFAARNGSGAKFAPSDELGLSFDSPYTVTQTVKRTALHYKIRGQSLLIGKPLLEIVGISTALAGVLTLIFSLMLAFCIKPLPGGETGTYVISGLVCFVILSIFLQKGE